MVLHPGDKDLIARPYDRAPEALRHEVDTLSHAADEYHFAARRRVEETRHLLARALVCLGRKLAQMVHRAMDVCILGAVVPGQRVDDGSRLLRGRGVVQVDEGLPVDLRGQDGELGAHARHVEAGCAGGRRTGSDDGTRWHRRAYSAYPSRASTSRFSSSRTGGSATSSTTSAANA